MSNEVTKEMLDESLASIQEYLDNMSAEQFEKDYLEIREFMEGGIPAAEIIGWEPEEIREEANLAREGMGCPLDKGTDL